MITTDQKNYEKKKRPTTRFHRFKPDMARKLLSFTVSV